MPRIYKPVVGPSDNKAANPVKETKKLPEKKQSEPEKKQTETDKK